MQTVTHLNYYFVLIATLPIGIRGTLVIISIIQINYKFAMGKEISSSGVTYRPFAFFSKV